MTLAAIFNIRNYSLVSELLDALENSGVSIGLWHDSISATSNKTTLILTIRDTDTPKLIQILENLNSSQNLRLRHKLTSSLSHVNLEGDKKAMESIGIINRVYSLFREIGVKTHFSTSSETSLTWVVNKKTRDTLMGALSDIF